MNIVLIQNINFSHFTTDKAQYSDRSLGIRTCVQQDVSAGCLRLAEKDFAGTRSRRWLSSTEKALFCNCYKIRESDWVYF